MQVAKAQAVRAEERAREEEGKTRALKDDVARGRKALDNLKVAAGVSLRNTK
jgi:hypothetical protein